MDQAGKPGAESLCLICKSDAEREGEGRREGEGKRRRDVERESLKTGPNEGFETSKPRPVTCILQQHHTSETFLISSTNWRYTMEICEPIRVFSFKAPQCPGMRKAYLAMSLLTKSSQWHHPCLTSGTFHLFPVLYFLHSASEIRAHP